MMSSRILALAAVALLSACASGGHCVGEFDYQKAASLPPATAVQGLAVPESASALRIPPPAAKPVPYAEFYPDPEDPEDRKVRCLDVPQALPEPKPEETKKS